MPDTQQLVVIVMMFDSELPRDQAKMRNTWSYIALLSNTRKPFSGGLDYSLVLLFDLNQVNVPPFFVSLRDFNFCDLSPSSRESSGLVLLSSCPQTASRLQKFFTHSRRAQRPIATYWWEVLGGSHGSGEVPASHSVTFSCLFHRAVTDGIPTTSEGKIQAALKLEHIDGVSLVSQGLGGEG